MKKLVLITIAFFAASANATSSLNAVKEARKDLETRTENQILEKLEASRLQDERNRREKFESLNFSVVNEQPVQTAPVAAAPAPYVPAVTTPLVTAETADF
ncbi:MAG: hypothetical protein HUU57_12950 [Bdellovibrio sp.]|nr:hypothetical protein [Bdellovibrio sp.]